MTRAAIVAGARTPVCRAGGRLKDVPALELALAAARGAVADAGIDAGSLDGLVAAAGVPGNPRELGLGAAVAAELAPGLDAIEVGGLVDAGAHALALAAALVAGEQRRRVLVVGADSASRAPYWVPGLRWGAAGEDATVVDPLATVAAEAGARADDGDRAAIDAFARRSHELVRAPGGERPIAVAGVGEDEPARPEGSLEALVDLKPLFHPDGAVSAAATAQPADGAAAVLVSAREEGPWIAAEAGAPEAHAAAARALERAGVGSGELAAAELHEGTAAEAVALAEGLGLPLDLVNAAGGAIGQGLASAAAGVLMALRLRRRLDAGEAGLLATPRRALVLRS